MVPDWSPYHVSGWETEYFVKWGTDGEPRFEGDLWRSRLDMAAWCADHHVPLLAVTYGSAEDTGACKKYHQATWLLAWDGTTGASVFVPEQPDAGLWQARANTDISRPATTPDPARERRLPAAYSGGIVVVNPTSATRAVEQRRHLPAGPQPADHLGPARPRNGRHAAPGCADAFPTARTTNSAGRRTEPRGACHPAPVEPTRAARR